MIKLSKLVSELYTFGDRDKPPYSRFDTAREQQIKEIGDSSAKPYPSHRMGRNIAFDTITYEFDAQAGEYQVDIEKVDLEDGTLKYIVGFGLKDDTRRTNVNYRKETNAGELFNVMATVVKIVKKEMKLDEDNEYYVTKIAFSPTKESDYDRRRENLYLAYIKKNIPNITDDDVKVDEHGDEVEVTIKKPNNEDVEQHGAWVKFVSNKK